MKGRFVGPGGSFLCLAYLDEETSRGRSERRRMKATETIVKPMILFCIDQCCMCIMLAEYS